MTYTGPTLTPLLAVTADTHLDQYNWARHPDVCGDSHESFRQFKNYCIRHHIPGLLLGDIFENAHPDSGSVQFFGQCMEEFRVAGLPVYYVQGDHDRVAPPQPPWPSAAHAWPTHINHSLITIGDRFTLYGLDYQPGGMDALFEQLPLYHILAVHCAWHEVQGIGGTDASVRKLSGSGFVLSGDYHRHGIWNLPTDAGHTITLYSPGSTNMRAVDESSDKYFWVMSCCDDGTLTMNPERYLTRTFVRSNIIRTPVELDMQVTWFSGPVTIRNAAMPECIRKPIAYVRYLDNLPQAYERLRQAAGDRYHLFLEPIHVTAEEVVLTELPIDGRSEFEGLSAGLTHFAPTASAEYHVLRRLLESPDKAAEVQRMYDEYMEIARVTQASERAREIAESHLSQGDQAEAQGAQAAPGE